MLLWIPRGVELSLFMYGVFPGLLKVNAFSVTYPLRTAGRRNVSAAHNNEAQGLGKRGTTYQCVDMMIIVTNYGNQYMHCNMQSGKLNDVV